MAEEKTMSDEGPLCPYCARQYTDDAGRTVLRATVDFYDGASPSELTFKTVWEREPVRIVLANPEKK